VPAGAGPRAHQYIEPGVDGTGIDASVDLWGGGGLISDTHDLATFMRALVGGQVLGKVSLERMLAVSFPQSGPSPARGVFRVMVGTQACWGHDGFWGAAVIHCPESGVTAAATINTSLVGLTPATGLDPFAFVSRLAATALGA
jgi:D-alanyl-D-alanine carboxypeptidase